MQMFAPRATHFHGFFRVYVARSRFFPRLKQTKISASKHNARLSSQSSCVILVRSFVSFLVEKENDDRGGRNFILIIPAKLSEQNFSGEDLIFRWMLLIIRCCCCRFCRCCSCRRRCSLALLLLRTFSVALLCRRRPYSLCLLLLLTVLRKHERMLLLLLLVVVV